jgi:hypothetical protein
MLSNSAVKFTLRRYIMTHAYFMFYHVLSNAALRYIRSAYQSNAQRFVFECGKAWQIMLATSSSIL